MCVCVGGGGGHMQEGLVNACIDMYESEPTSPLTSKGHGARITTSTP